MAASISASVRISGRGLMTDCWITAAAGSMAWTPLSCSQRKNDLSDVTRREYVFGLHFWLVRCHVSQLSRSRVVTCPTFLKAPRNWAARLRSPIKALTVLAGLRSFSRWSRQAMMAAVSDAPELSAGAVAGKVEAGGWLGGRALSVRPRVGNQGHRSGYCAVPH